MTTCAGMVRASVRFLCFSLVTFAALASSLSAQTFSCPAGQIDVMKYFTMDQQRRPDEFMSGSTNPIYTEVYPNLDYADSGYWFWLKSPSAHGFDVKVFDQHFVYMRATELNWADNSSFKRFVNDLPIAARCITAGKPGPTIKVANTTFKYYGHCSPYQSSTLGTSINTLDGPVLMNVGGNVGSVYTRVLHYRYDCDSNYGNCADEEQFFLANGYGLWQWRHYKNKVFKASALMNHLQQGIANETLPCQNSYK